MKVNQKRFVKNATFSAGATTGAMGSHVVTGKFTTTLKSGAARHGLLGIVGTTITVFVSPKDNTTEFAQGAGAGIAITQLTAALKVVTAEDGKKTVEKGIMKTALGSPETEVVYVDSTSSPDYYPYEGVSTTTTTRPTVFLSASSQFAEV